MSNNQTQQIHTHLQAHGAITPLEALNLYGCFRLGARIWELRRAGIRIKTQKVSVETRAGHRSEIARYVILKNAEG